MLEAILGKPPEKFRMIPVKQSIRNRSECRNTGGFSRKIINKYSNLGKMLVGIRNSKTSSVKKYGRNLVKKPWREIQEIFAKKFQEETLTEFLENLLLFNYAIQYRLVGQKYDPSGYIQKMSEKNQIK